MKVFHCKWVWWVGVVINYNPSPLCRACVVVDSEGDCLCVTMYNIAVTAHLNIGSILTIPLPIATHISLPHLVSVTSRDHTPSSAFTGSRLLVCESDISSSGWLQWTASSSSLPVISGGEHEGHSLTPNAATQVTLPTPNATFLNYVHNNDIKDFITLMNCTVRGLKSTAYLFAVFSLSTPTRFHH